ncbi:MAG: aminoglycoside 3-N-acetyltransferase [Candidatus Tumulicola sp.]
MGVRVPFWPDAVCPTVAPPQRGAKRGAVLKLAVAKRLQATPWGFESLSGQRTAARSHQIEFLVIYRSSRPFERPATRRSLANDLRSIGIAQGDVLMVHAAVRKLGPVLGGVTTLVQALLDAVGDRGTLVAYVDWEPGFDPYAVDEALADDVPIFDKHIARAAREYGILPEVIRTWPGAVRSDNPDAGIAAIGARAEWLCQDHAFSYGYGRGSPYAKLVEIGAKVIVLGAPLETITLLHHAETVARLTAKRVKRYSRKLLINGEACWVDIEEFESSEPVVDGMPADHFSQIASVALKAGAGRYGRVAAADSYLFDSPALHRVAVRWLEEWQRDR